MNSPEYTAVCGYGVCVSDLDAHDPARLAELLAFEPALSEKVRSALTANENLTFHDALKLCSGYTKDGCTLSRIMQDYIMFFFGLDMTPCLSSDGNEYLLFLPVYPWSEDYPDPATIDDYSAITQDSVDSAFQNCIQLLTDTPVTPDYHTVITGRK